MFRAEINAETRTTYGGPISTFYRSTAQPTMAAVYDWVKYVERGLSLHHTTAYITIRREDGTIHQHYRWTYSGGPRRPYCPGKRRKYR